MKVLISDYPDSMMPTHDIEIDTLEKALGKDTVEVEVYPYSDEKHDEFIEKLQGADALLTAFVHISADDIANCPRLKAIAINATGFDNVDMDAATKRGIAVMPVGEYCTQDVSESAIAYMFSLNKHFKQYSHDLLANKKWDYASAPQWPRLEEQCLGIFGFGKIGKCTAKKAKALVKTIIAYDPYVDDAAFAELGVIRAATPEQVYETADIIINHMRLTKENRGFFSKEQFNKMLRQPIFINLGRGLSVNEDDLLDALETGQIRAFGADVLKDETPDLSNNPLLERHNVQITPHSAFYSLSSMRDLQTIPCNNIANFFLGKREAIFKLANDVPVKKLC